MSGPESVPSKSQRETVLVTGGAGFIGSRLSRRLVADGHQVRLLDSLLPQVHGEKPNPSLEGCETFWADVRDKEAVARAMSGVTTLYHLAAETGVGQSQYEIARYVSANTEGTAVVLEAAVACGVRHVVVASSRAVYGEGAWRCARCRTSFSPRARRAEELAGGFWEIRCPTCGAKADPLPMSEGNGLAPSSVYGLTKLHQEELTEIVARTHELQTTVLRFFNVYGPGQSLHNPYVGVLGTFLRRAVAGDMVEVYEDGRMSRDFVYVDDVVDVLAQCLGNARMRNRVLNVGSGRAIDLETVAREVFRVLELPARVTISGRYRVGDVRHAVADISALREVSHHVPATHFGDGLRRFVDWALETQADACDADAEGELVAHNLLRQGRS